ncbi:hypothetical protein E2C01_010309 [Portunus trituberculatus]|uniref:Uncharacterized protein n=1 Tax=Portunus trituberculatus TaxID=210409 RepID=A0A5B7D846_PORTR|nr:hypothetical protein [Portunus trituberculatus]
MMTPPHIASHRHHHHYYTTSLSPPPPLPCLPLHHQHHHTSSPLLGLETRPRRWNRTPMPTRAAILNFCLPETIPVTSAQPAPDVTSSPRPFILLALTNFHNSIPRAWALNQHVS